MEWLKYLKDSSWNFEPFCPSNNVSGKCIWKWTAYVFLAFVFQQQIMCLNISIWHFDF